MILGGELCPWLLLNHYVKTTMSSEGQNHASAAADDKSEIPVPDGSQAQEVQGASNRVVLLVEYEDALARSLGLLLEHDGFKVLRADTAEAGLAVCQQHESNIDFLIVNVPGDPAVGFDLAVAVATKHPKISILFTWSPPLSIDGTKCDTCRRAAEHFLPKPFIYSQLHRKILQLAEEQSAPALEWLLHFYKKPEPPVSSAVQKVQPEAKHRITVQLEVLLQGENLFAPGFLRQPDGNERPCLIELQIQGLRVWRPLRLEDARQISEPQVRLIVDSSTGDQEIGTHQPKQRKKRSPKQS